MFTQNSKDQNYFQIGVIFVKFLDLSMKYKQGHKMAWIIAFPLLETSVLLHNIFPYTKKFEEHLKIKLIQVPTQFCGLIEDYI